MSSGVTSNPTTSSSGSGSHSHSHSHNTTASAALAGLSWQELRREATRLEDQVDVRIVALGKAGTASTGGDSQAIELMSQDAQQLLDKLTEVNNLLSEKLNADTNASQTMKHYTQRHQAILSDYCLEFERTQQNIRRQRDRAELLTSVRKDINSYRSSGQDKAADLYLKEHEHIINSERLAEETLNVASTAKEVLLGQRNSLRGIGSKLQNTTQRFPVLNNLVQKINLRKRRDAVVLGLVISGCIIFILWYSLR